MPQGKGTYGSKVGRPPKSKKKGKSKATKVSAMDKMYGVETDKMKTYQQGGYTSAMDEYKQGLYGGTTSYDLETQSPRELDWEAFRKSKTEEKFTPPPPLGGKQTFKKKYVAPVDPTVTGVVPDVPDVTSDVDPYYEDEIVTQDDPLVNNPYLGDIGTSGYNEGGSIQSSDARIRSQKIKGYGGELDNG
jgi:hypothetical protein